MWFDGGAGMDRYLQSLRREKGLANYLILELHFSTKRQPTRITMTQNSKKGKNVFKMFH